MRRNLYTVLEYFGYFLYAPSFEEIYTFFPKKIVKKDLQTLIDTEIKREKIVRLPNHIIIGASQSFIDEFFPTKKHPLYTLPQYSTKILTNNYKKLDVAVHIYILILKMCPLVQYVGVTGKSAMRGPQKDDDLDLCIVTKRTLLWTTRFISVVCAKILGVHTKTGVCLNLFFDERDILIPKQKQNSYIAHELLQMKPIVDKDNVHQRFLSANEWIYRYFPNAQKLASHITPEKAKAHPLNFNTEKYDSLFKSIQLPIILRNRAAFFITSTQLWLFKNDFEKKLKRVGLVI